MQKTRYFLTTFIALGIFYAAQINAATFTVTNADNDGAGSLRQAIADSNSAAGSDTIQFDPTFFSSARTISLTSSLLVSPANGETLTITGPGANLLTITGGGNVGRAFDRAVTAHTLSISGMTLTGFISSALINGNNGGLSALNVTNVAFASNSAGNGFGGAIYSNAALTVTGCTFTSNAAVNRTAGGAIYSSVNAGVAVIITGSTFTGNNADFISAGGAIYAAGGMTTITGSAFNNNTATNSSTGGAIYNASSMTITNSIFSGNSASNNSTGAGIATENQLTINSSTITGNSATGDAGGIYSFFASGVLNINNSTVSNNIADSDNDSVGGSGGGIYLRSDSGLTTITNSTVSGNRAQGASGDGGGIYAGAALNLTNSTVSGNFASRSYGGIFDVENGTGTDIVNISGATIVSNTANVNFGGYGINSDNPAQNSFRNTIVADNTANGGFRRSDFNKIGDGSFGALANDIGGRINSLGYNLFENTVGANITGTTTGNITGVNPNLGPLQNNGGPTFTHALLAGSPAIDTGDPANYPPIDQRGRSRPVDGDNSGGAQPDIGAYEFAAPTAAAVSLAGRVVTPGGNGLTNAFVVLTRQTGEMRTTQTSSFGYYRFDEIPAGETYILSVRSKRFSFAPRIVTAMDDLTDLNLTAQPEVRENASDMKISTLQFDPERRR